MSAADVEQHKNEPVILVKGDGIGPEITDAVVSILQAAGAAIDFEEVAFGKDATADEINAAVARMAEVGTILKAPTSTPDTLGATKSFNVTMRKGLGLFANFRPAWSMNPYVQSKHSNHDVLVVRENEEGLYAAIEHRQTEDVIQALSYKSESGMERIIRAAFEQAIAEGRERLTVMHKGNILKLTEGKFKEIFEKIAEEYEEAGLIKRNIVGHGDAKKGIIADAQIIDIGMAKFANDPEQYSAIVTENLFGDILSDINAELAGSVGMAGTANIGSRAAMFEAVHGTAPDIAGQNIANPSGLLNAAIMMLEHLGKENPQHLETATIIRDAWLWTLADGIHTGDIKSQHNGMVGRLAMRVGLGRFLGTKETAVGTQEFTQAVIERVQRIQRGEEPQLGDLADKHIDFAERASEREKRVNWITRHGLKKLSALDRLTAIDDQQELPDSRQSLQETAAHEYSRPEKLQKESKWKGEALDGADLFITWTGMDKEVIRRFEAATNLELGQHMQLEAFRTIQEMYEFAHWLQTGLKQAMQQIDGAGAMRLTDPAIADVLNQWGIDRQFPGLKPEAFNLTVGEMAEHLQTIASQHRVMVAATNQVLAERLNNVAKDSGMQVEMMSNRGQSVWPYLMDPDMVDHVRVRFRFEEEAHERKPENMQAALVRVAELQVAMARDGLTVTKHEKLQTHNDKDNPDVRIAGYAKSYGQNMGATTEQVLMAA